jgi:hypothetical protein
MWLGDVVTLAVGTLIVLVLIHLAVFWVTSIKSSPQPTVVYMQPPPQAPAFVQPPETQQTAHVPTLDPKLHMSAPMPELPRRHGE